MKIFLLAAILVAPNLLLAAAPSLSLVDRYLAAALNASPDQLSKPAKYTCTNDIVPNKSIGTGSTMQEAQTNYILQCIQEQCASLNDRIKESVTDILKLSDQELTDFLYGNGSTQDEIQKALTVKRKPPENLPTVTCRNATALARTFVVDNCFATPVRCSDN